MLANANDTPDIDELAGMLTRGEFPENYDDIIRNISDDDLERLWAAFKQKWRVNNDGGGDVPAQAHTPEETLLCSSGDRGPILG